MKKTFETSDGATLAYTDEGSGKALILLPGWSQSAAMFRHQIVHLSKSRRVIALDFRGHGQSPMRRMVIGSIGSPATYRN